MDRLMLYMAVSTICFVWGSFWFSEGNWCSNDFLPMLCILGN